MEELRRIAAAVNERQAVLAAAGVRFEVPGFASADDPRHPLRQQRSPSLTTSGRTVCRQTYLAGSEK
jgi:hypothetical protein